MTRRCGSRCSTSRCSSSPASKLKPIRAHGNYGCGLNKGLGIAFK